MEEMKRSLQQSQQHALTITAELSRNQEQLDRAGENVLALGNELGVSGFLLGTIERLRKRKQVQFFLVLCIVFLSLVLSLLRYFRSS